MRCAFDTNALIYYLNGDQAISAILEHVRQNGDVPIMSIISRIELLSLPNMSDHEEQAVEKMISSFHVADLTPPIVEDTIRIRKSAKLRIPDGIIAATALTLDATLVTSDQRMFRKVSGLHIINPHAKNGRQP